MLVLVAGCGRMGRHVAEMLFQSGTEVIVVDHSAEALEALSDSFTGLTYRGDVREITTLEEAGIERADVVLACTGDENANLLVAEVAQNTYDVPRAIIRALDPLKQEVLEQMGVESVCPVLLGATAILEALGLPEMEG